MIYLRMKKKDMIKHYEDMLKSIERKRKENFFAKKRLKKSLQN